MMSINVRARGLAGALAEMGIPQDLEGPQLNGVTELIETAVDVQPAPIVPMPSAEEVALFAQAARLVCNIPVSNDKADGHHRYRGQQRRKKLLILARY